MWKAQSRCVCWNAGRGETGRETWHREEDRRRGGLDGAFGPLKQMQMQARLGHSLLLVLYWPQARRSEVIDVRTVDGYERHGGQRAFAFDGKHSEGLTCSFFVGLAVPAAAPRGFRVEFCDLFWRRVVSALTGPFLGILNSRSNSYEYMLMFSR